MKKLICYADGCCEPRNPGGHWGINQGFYVTLAYDAKKKLESFKNIRFEWIPGDTNDYADELSKRPMKAAGVVFRIHPNG